MEKREASSPNIRTTPRSVIMVYIRTGLFSSTLTYLLKFRLYNNDSLKLYTLKVIRTKNKDIHFKLRSE